MQHTRVRMHAGVWAQVTGGARTYTLRGMTKSHLASVCEAAAALRVRDPRMVWAAVHAVLAGSWQTQPAGSAQRVAAAAAAPRRRALGCAHEGPHVPAQSDGLCKREGALATAVQLRPSVAPPPPSRPPPLRLLASLISSLCTLHLPLPLPLLAAVAAACSCRRTAARLQPRALHALLCSDAYPAAAPRPRTRARVLPRPTLSIRSSVGAGGGSRAIHAAVRPARIRTHLPAVRQQRRCGQHRGGAAGAAAALDVLGGARGRQRAALPAAFLASPRTFALLASHARAHVRSYAPGAQLAWGGPVVQLGEMVALDSSLRALGNLFIYRHLVSEALRLGRDETLGGVQWMAFRPCPLKSLHRLGARAKFRLRLAQVVPCLLQLP